MSQKQTLRTESIRHRARMHYDIEDIDAAKDLFFDTIQPKSNQIIAGYWTKDKEFDTYPILETLLGQGITCCLPIVQKDTKTLKFGKWNENIPLKKGAFDILEPETHEFLDPDIVIVPLLAFDRYGNRLGYGGGYYDATLAELRKRKKITTIGLAYAQQACLFKLPTDEHDQKLDFVITPQEAHEFGA